MDNLEYKIIDNFLEKEDFYKFQQEIFSNNIPWYYRNSLTIESINSLEDNGYFSLCFFNKLFNDFNGFDYFLNKIYQKLECKALVQSRANLILKQDKVNKLHFHVDNTFKCNTAIFYMNTNDGATILNENKKIKIESIENRMLIFNSQIEHAALIQSNEKRRIVININYF